jgi:hypothetical protein
MVSAVVPGGPCDKSFNGGTIQEDDEIVEIDGKKYDSEGLPAVSSDPLSTSLLSMLWYSTMKLHAIAMCSSCAKSSFRGDDLRALLNRHSVATMLSDQVCASNYGSRPESFLSAPSNEEQLQESRPLESFF